MRQSANNFWLEICTASGIERTAIDDDRCDPVKKPEHAKDNHCPLCLLRFAAIMQADPTWNIVTPEANTPVLFIRDNYFLRNQTSFQTLQPCAPLRSLTSLEFFEWLLAKTLAVSFRCSLGKNNE